MFIFGISLLAQNNPVANHSGSGNDRRMPEMPAAITGFKVNLARNTAIIFP